MAHSLELPNTALLSVACRACELQGRCAYGAELPWCLSCSTCTGGASKRATAANRPAPTRHLCYAALRRKALSTPALRTLHPFPSTSSPWRLSCRFCPVLGDHPFVCSQVLEDLEATLGPLPPRQQLSCDAITEVYSSDRAMLACLPRDLLDQVRTGARAQRAAKQASRHICVGVLHCAACPSPDVHDVRRVVHGAARSSPDVHDDEGVVHPCCCPTCRP